MKIKTILLILVLLTVGLRLLISLSTPDINYDSYFALRQVDSITHTGLPLYTDPYSYGGKINLFLPFFYYVLAGFAFILPALFVIKMLPILFFGVTLYFVFALAVKLTNNEPTALLITSFASFLPITLTFNNSSFFLNSATPLSLGIPALLGALYYFMSIEQKNHPSLVLIFTFILAFTTPLALILLLVYLLYLILLKTEAIPSPGQEREIVLFTFFLVLWVNLVVFKKALLAHGPAIIWQNLPAGMLQNFFSKISFLDSIYTVGVIPLLFGIYVIYKAFSKKPSKKLLLLVAGIMCSFILLWFRLVPLSEGLLLLGLLLVIASAHAFRALFLYLSKTRFERYRPHVFIVVIILFLVSSAIPALVTAFTSTTATPSPQEKEALLWIRDNTPKESVVLGTVQEGSIIAFVAERKNFMDINFLLSTDVNQRYAAANTIFSTPLAANAVNALKENHIEYIYLSKKYKELYGLQNLPYAKDTTCLSLVYNKTVMIYAFTCGVS
ncbi:MAG: hypothetical protein V1725_02850 [archaeon]